MTSRKDSSNSYIFALIIDFSSNLNNILVYKLLLCENPYVSLIRSNNNFNSDQLTLSFRKNTQIKKFVQHTTQ